MFCPKSVGKKVGGPGTYTGASRGIAPALTANSVSGSTILGSIAGPYSRSAEQWLSKALNDARLSAIRTLVATALETTKWIATEVKSFALLRGLEFIPNKYGQQYSFNVEHVHAVAQRFTRDGREKSTLH